MMSVLICIAVEHNPWLVGLAALVCLAGSWVTLRLLAQAQTTARAQRLGWQFLAAVAAGSSIWSTHFIAMLGYDPGVPIGFEPVLTAVSLLIAIAGTGIGFILATMSSSRLAPAVGGVVVGLAISGMHYTGMFAYRVDGLVDWHAGYFAASIVLAAVFGALSLEAVLRRAVPYGRHVGVVLLVLAIVSLHFTAMTAFQVTPLALGGQISDPAMLEAMALAVAVGGLIIAGTGLASFLIDSQTRRESHRQLREMSLTDSLTGLPNRASFMGCLDRRIAAIDEHGGQVAVVAFNLDRFKDINDLRGHSAGDEVLRVLAGRMRALLGGSELIARLGGDEFAAVMSYRDGADLAHFVERLQAAVVQPIAVGHFDAMLGASFGVASYPTNADSAEILVNNAGLAMYRAKTDAGRSVCYYDARVDETVRRRRALAEDLRGAVEREELEVLYQVQAAVATGELRGYEALLRWRHPVHGAVRPDEFIPLAEETGLILPLGEWVLRRACRDAASWPADRKVAVNLSPVQFAHADLPRLIHEVLLETGLSPRQLELELTESTLISDKSRSLHILRQVKLLGVSVALDDFGTGYSSLDTLRSFPFDKIKLDRSFMTDVETSRQSQAIIRAVLALAKSLDIPVLAEGVETHRQLMVLNAEGCEAAQGFLFGRPLPAGEVAALAAAEASGEADPRLSGRAA
ncbi:MAG TPA: EAL domain-containing protein [Afifellaceae bacterium]|nr:EAL domain-containing protein [Afifellaceae bacterium]